MRFLITRTAAPILAVGVVALAAGCGGGSSSSSSTSSSSSSASSGAAGSRASIADCLRKHGVNAPSRPTQSGSSQTPGTPQGPGLNFSDPKVRAALQACGGGRPPGGGNLTQAQQQQRQQAFAAYSACMTSHGVAASSPMQLRQLDQTDPKVQTAMKACRSKLPQRGFGPGAPQGGAPPASGTSS